MTLFLIENHCCENLQKAAELYTYKYFEDVIHNEEFLTLSVKDVEKLIKSDEIQVDNNIISTTVVRSET